MIEILLKVMSIIVNLTLNPKLKLHINQKFQQILSFFNFGTIYNFSYIIISS